MTRTTKADRYGNFRLVKLNPKCRRAKQRYNKRTKKQQETPLRVRLEREKALALVKTLIRHHAKCALAHSSYESALRFRSKTTPHCTCGLEAALRALETQ